MARELSALLLAWYSSHKRDLPWRRNADPYSVWVSEVMLQQTQVATATPYYQRWMKRFPSVSSLAVAEESDVLQAWQGLGYYSRARALRNGAQAVLENFGGSIPTDVPSLKRLPGVGPYTAGAIASIAFGQDEAVVDGNVIRVLTRLFALRGDPAKTPLKNALWSLAGELIPKGRASDFNQALMELGALTCTPKRADCGGCPLRKQCRAFAQDEVERFPETRARPKVTDVHVAAALLRRGKKVLLVQLPESAPRWASMWQFPSVEHAAEQDGARAAERAALDTCGLGVRATDKVLTVKHSVTRYRVHLSFYETERLGGRLRAQGCARAHWCRPEELTEFALPAAHRRFATHIST